MRSSGCSHRNWPVWGNASCRIPRGGELGLCVCSVWRPSTTQSCPALDNLPPPSSVCNRHSIFLITPTGLKTRPSTWDGRQESSSDPAVRRQEPQTGEQGREGVGRCEVTRGPRGQLRRPGPGIPEAWRPGGGGRGEGERGGAAGAPTGRGPPRTPYP